MLDEHLLREPVRLVDVLVVMPFPHLSDSCELFDPECAARLAERLEGVFRLTAGHDIADETEEVALSHGISEITRNAERLAEHLLGDAGLGADTGLKVLQQSLVLAHVRNVARAEVAKTLIFRLALVILEVLQEGSVLHHRVVDLALEKIDAALHQAPSGVDDVRSQGGVQDAGQPHVRRFLELAVDDLASELEELARQRHDVLDGEILERVKQRTLEAHPGRPAWQ